MKTVLCSVLLLLVLSNITSGQSSPSNFNPNILVHSQGLPNEFLLFVPDTATQILFNPARANDYTGSFVYTTYAADYKRSVFLPIYYVGDIRFSNLNYTPVYPPQGNTETYDSGKNPTIAIATLFNALNSKWLFLFTHGVSKQNGTNDNKSENIHPDSYYQTYMESYSLKEDEENKEARTSFRLSNIFSSGIGKGSIGIFATHNTSFNNSLRNASNQSLRISSSTSKNHYASNSNSTDRLNENKSQYVVGFEFSLTQERWDYIARVSYKKSTDNRKSNTYSNQQTLDSTYYGPNYTPVSSSNKNNNVKSSDYNTQSEPYILALENYYQQRTSFLSLDGNFFVSASVNYSSGDGKTDGKSFSIYEYFNNGNLTSQNSTINSAEGKFNNKNWGFTITPGFVLKKNFTDLFLLSGINLETGYRKNSSGKTEASTIYYINYPIVVTTSTTKLAFVSITLPVYMNYTPAEWISVWGGINYSYGYNKGIIESTTSSINPSYPQIYSMHSKNDNSSYQSMKSTFLGLELKHSSGLRVQISFDEDVASFRDWNMSVGYHF